MISGDEHVQNIVYIYCILFVFLIYVVHPYIKGLGIDSFASNIWDHRVTSYNR